MKVLVAILAICAISAQARRIINTNNADNGGVINNSNIIHREARAISNTNTASGGGVINNKNVIGSAPSGHAVSSSSYQQIPTRFGHGSIIDNTNRASLGGMVNNGNVNGHDASSVSSSNANGVSNGGGFIDNRNTIGGGMSSMAGISSYQQRPQTLGSSSGTIDNTNQASFNGLHNHRQARSMAALNQALETVAGVRSAGGSPQHYVHNYGSSSHISNENHIMPGSGASIQNVNVIHREARDVSAAVNEDQVKSVVSRKTRSYDPQDSTHPHSIMLHAMHLAAHTKGRY